MAIRGFVDNVLFQDGKAILCGWAIDEKDSNVIINVFHSNIKLGEGIANKFRADLQEQQKDGLCGFEIKINYKSDMDIKVQANNKTLIFTDNVKLSLTQLPSLELDLAPLLVMPTGRNGSTMLMSILKTSTDIVLDDKYPFENRYFLHFLHLAKTINRDYQENKCWNDEKLMEIDHLNIGPMLFDSNGFINKKLMSQNMLKSLWNDFNIQINKKHYKYYAEKSWIGVSDHLINMFNITNVKKIILLRDPRDVLLSVYNFNQKRGYNSFGWEEEDTLLTYLQRSMKGFIFWFSYAKEHQNDSNLLILKYEDLVLKDEKAFKKIESFLDIKLNLNKLETFSNHMTSKDINKSLYKWKSELDSNLVEIINKDMYEVLEYFGYEV